MTIRNEITDGHRLTVAHRFRHNERSSWRSAKTPIRNTGDET
jgi:hypothetical protein